MFIDIILGYWGFHYEDELKCKDVSTFFSRQKKGKGIVEGGAKDPQWVNVESAMLDHLGEKMMR